MSKQPAALPDSATEHTQSDIRRRMDKINRKQIRWANAEADIQTECRHPYRTAVYKSNSGNYDPSADSAWIEYTCPDCGRRWNVDQ